MEEYYKETFKKYNGFHDMQLVPKKFSFWFLHQIKITDSNEKAKINVEDYRTDAHAKVCIVFIYFSKIKCK